MNKESISAERKQYLKQKKRKKYLILLTQIAILVCFLALWEILADYNIIDSFIMSKPSRILDTFFNLTSNDLLKHIWVTTYETIIGFLVGTLLGIMIAIILWWSNFISKVAEPFLVVLNSLPKVALGPVIIIWVGARYTCNYCHGNCYFFSRYDFRKLKWFLKYRQRHYQNGKNFSC